MSAPELTILGSSSATPSRDRNPSAQILKIGSEKILIDCGEGTQMRLMQFGIRQNGLNYICISHLHGDHYFGLIGIISTMNLLGRKHPLHIIGPPKLRDIIEIHLMNGGRRPDFEINYYMTNPELPEVIFKTAEFELSTFPLRHNIHCTGFLIKETEKERHLNVENIDKFKIPVSFYKLIKQGADYTDEKGNEIANHLLSFDPNPVRSYAYCCDTIFDTGLVPYIQNCTVLYHEATYMEALIEKATERYHSTGKQAGIIARMANVKHLLIGHFSSRYDDLQPLLIEAKSEFENTALAIEGNKFNIDGLHFSNPDHVYTLDINNNSLN